MGPCDRRALFLFGTLGTVGAIGAMLACGSSSPSVPVGSSGEAGVDTPDSTTRILDAANIVEGAAMLKTSCLTFGKLAAK